MQRYLFPGLFLAAIIIAGCGGGVGSGFSPAPATPGPAVTISPGPAATTVAFSASGYQLQITVPAIYAGGGTIAATVQTSAPAGVPVPEFKRRGISRSPKLIGSAVSTLLYIVFTPAATVQFTSIPSFKFTLPSGVSIPSGDSSYVAYYDPTQQNANNGWIGVLGPGTVSGQTDTFAGINSGVTFIGGQTYVFALVYTPEAVPTASPAPTPTPVTVSQAAYCSDYKGVDTATPGLTINITDSSKLSGGAVLIVYVSEQNPGQPQYWMTAKGVFSASTPVPLPAACYSTTVASGITNNPLVIPAGAAGRIWLAYASPAPSGVPNPFSNLTSGGQPNIGVGQEPYPYDKIEYNSTSGVIDTTQVDFLGLPIEMNAIQGAATPLPEAVESTCPSPLPTASPFTGVPVSPTVVGVGQCGYAAIYGSLKKDPTFGGSYGQLVSVLKWTSTQTIDYRAVAPAKAFSFTPFDFNVFGDPKVPLPQACVGIVGASTGTYGYLSCLIAKYQNDPQVYQAVASLGGNGSGDYYCISSDGASNFIATNVGATAPASCSSATAASTSATLPVNPFKLPVALFTNLITPTGDVPTPRPAASPCAYNEFYGTPWGNPNVDEWYGGATIDTSLHHVFATNDAFTLWKALILEMNYGTAFQTGTHPVESTPPSFQSSVPMFSDPASNFYAKIVHSYFDGNYAYAIGYDDAFKWFSGYSIAGGTVNIRINPIPTGSPSTNPNPAATSNPACSNITPDVGSY